MDDNLKNTVAKHNQVFMGNGQKGMAEKVDELYEWFLTSRGKNSVIMFVKDVLISGGLIALFISRIFEGGSP